MVNVWKGLSFLLTNSAEDVGLKNRNNFIFHLMCQCPALARK